MLRVVAECDWVRSDHGWSVGCGEGPVTSGTASDLTLAVQPSSSALTGVPFLVQPQVQVADNSGNPVPQSGIPITAELAAGSGGL